MRFKRVYIVNFDHTTTPQLEKCPSSYRWVSLKLLNRIEKIGKLIISQKDPLIEDPQKTHERDKVLYKLDAKVEGNVWKVRYIRITQCDKDKKRIMCEV